MSLRNTETQYGRIAQIFHWLSALLILMMWPMGIIMVRLSEDATGRLYKAHVGLGIAVLILTILRLIWFFIEKPPETLNIAATWRKQAFIWNHRLLYIALLVLTLSGVSMLLASGLSLLPVSVTPEAIESSRPQQAHSLLSKFFIALLIMHIAGVINYQATKGKTLRRMGLPF